MKSVIFQSDSNKTLDLLLRLVKKPGVTAKVVIQEELEDVGLMRAAKSRRTGKFANTKKNSKDLV